MLISLFAAMGMAMNAETIKYNYGLFGYNLDTETKTAALAWYKGSPRVVTIPESVTHDDVTYSVTSLGEGCFWDCKALTSIDIPSSVTSLGRQCFEGCKSLTSVTIPSSVTSLGDYCLSGCSSLTSIDIPSSVTSLGNYCFSDCSSLTSIDIPSSVTSLGEGCFSGCESLTSITVDENNPVYDSRENCNAIIETGSNTMIAGCASTSIPSSVTSLGSYCFNGCESLTSINIPSSVTRLGDYCFSNCKSIKTMTCEIPTAIEGNFFRETLIDYATLYVPESSLDSYKATSPWSSFGTILPISTTGIGETATNGVSGIDAIYDIEGKRCNGTNRGLSIIRMSDGTTRKVLK